MNNHVKLGMLLKHALAIILFIASFSLYAASGDVAPKGTPDGIVNLADYIVVKQFVDGTAVPTQVEIQEADLAPVNNPDGIINAADLIVLRQKILDFNMSLVQASGIWVGECVKISTGEYQREVITIYPDKYVQEHINYPDSNCQQPPWLGVVKEYKPSLVNAESLGTDSGADIDLSLYNVFVKIYNSNPVDDDIIGSLNRYCNVSVSLSTELNDFSGMQCQGGVQYPSVGTKYFELIQYKNGVLKLGSKMDVTDANERAVTLSEQRTFTKSDTYPVTQ